ncbi:MAG: lamin tail domain-containing protein [Candidatus Moranbacteria bacterium]|nr:lamin tail domain-containing protein [Candidatus Moranbacteria bacterium]
MPGNCWADEKDLIITEVMYNPDGTDDKNEWIEIYNSGESEINIEKSLLGFIEKEGAFCHEFSDNLKLGSKEFAIIADDLDTFKINHGSFSGIALDSSFELPNSNSTIKISFDKCKTWKTEAKYESIWGGNGNNTSLEKINLTTSDIKENWQQSYKLGGTPGAENSTPPPPKTYSNKIRINEVLPNPKGTDSDLEWIEFYNYGDTKEDLDGWRLKDRNGTEHTLKQSDEINLEIISHGYVWFNPNKFSVPLHNSGTESIGLIDPNGNLISSVSYIGSDAKENISYNFDGASWRWSRFLTAGSANIFNTLPEIKSDVENKIYVNTYAEFSAKGSDADNDTLKYTWNFGDGHKSYLKKTTHKYEETGKYTATLTVSDNSEDVIKTFSIDVQEFPEQKVKIVRVMPNPKGKDSDLEFIEVQNKSKKKINLKNWSVATGTKNLYNHPITKDLIIKAGKILKITRTDSKFTLPNKKGKVELRYPDGQVASKIKYSKWGAGIADDETYEKTAGGWEWTAPAVTEIKTEENTTPETETIPEPEIIIPSVEDIEIPENILEEEDKNIQSYRETKRENRIALISFGTTINTPQAFFESQGKVLGASTVKETSDYFQFTPPGIPEEHYAVKFLRNFSFNINSWLNKILLF